MDPLSRQEKVAARIGIAFLFASIAVSTAIDRSSEDVIHGGDLPRDPGRGLGRALGPAERFVTEVVRHFFNRRRIGEFADIDVRFAWV